MLAENYIDKLISKGALQFDALAILNGEVYPLDNSDMYSITPTVNGDVISRSK